MHRHSTTLSIPLLLLILLSHSVSCQCPDASQKEQDQEQETRDKIIYLVLHISGVTAAGIASATRVSYPPSLFMDYAMFFTFYISVSFLLVVSLYVTYEFASPDMLLVGAAAGVIVAWRSVPRLWSTRARSLHWTAPMWRVREGHIYKRVRRIRSVDDGAELYWNGYKYPATLINGEPIFELVESVPLHWEDSVSDWKTFVIRGRLGDEQARRAALALRMAYTIPLPAQLPCGEGEYYASRGALGVEVARAWNLEQNVISAYQSLSQQAPRTLICCHSRPELAVVLHLKMLLYKPRDCTTPADWTFFATEWLFGEMLTSIQEPLQNVLACEKVSQGGNVFWNLIARSDPRMEEFTARRDREPV